MKPTEKYIITGDCRGLTYYLGLKTNRGIFAPEFIWYGIMENATDFRSEDYAKKVMGEVYPFTKIDMTVRLLSTVSKKLKRKLALATRGKVSLLKRGKKNAQAGNIKKQLPING
jgi:hypothetical protein